MWEILKWAFLDVKEDLVQDILKIEGAFLQDAFTVIFLVFLILLLALTIKNVKDFYQLRRYNKKVKRNIEKLIMTSFLAGKDKNKEEENIKDKK